MPPHLATSGNLLFWHNATELTPLSVEILCFLTNATARHDATGLLQDNVTAPCNE